VSIGTIPESVYRRIVDQLALELFCIGERRSPITNQLQRFTKDSKMKGYRELYRRIARRAIDFSRQEWPEAHCVVCKCTDSRACAEVCSWVVVNRLTGEGVCSNCVRENAA